MNRSKMWKRLTASAIVGALLIGYGGVAPLADVQAAAAPKSGAAKVIGKSGKPYDGPATEAEYWRYAAAERVNGIAALPADKLFATTESGKIVLVDAKDGKELFSKNVYVEMTAPVLGKGGDIWIGGKGARLYRYKADGNGEMAAMFYFKGRKDGLMPEHLTVDGKGLPYMAYQHGVASLDAKGEQRTALLPEGVGVSQLVPGKDGVYAIGSNGVLYAVRGDAILWEQKLDAPLRQAKLAADGSGGVVLLAGKALAVYGADGKLRSSGELAASPAGGWTFPVVLGAGNKAVVIAAEQSGNGVFAFRLTDGAERWRISAGGAGGFAPAALMLAPEGAGGPQQVWAVGRAGALYAIDPVRGMIAYSFKGAAAIAAGGAAPLAGGRIAYASADQLVAAGPFRPVAVTYPAAEVKLPLGTRLALTDKLKLSVPVETGYRSDNAKVATVSKEGIVTPVAKGKANLYIDVVSPGYKGTLKLPLEVTAAAVLKATHELKQVTVSGKTFSVQTVTIPKGMPVTVGTAERKIGKAQSLEGIAKAYNAEAAINGTFFSAYDGVPIPYGMMMSNGRLDYIGNTGTTIGFESDGSVVMDTLRVKILGGTEGKTTYPNNWYAYVVNKVPSKDGSSSAMFTPKYGPNLGFSHGTSVTVRNGEVTKIAKNENVAIPADGYVLVFTGSEERMLAGRFKKGTKVQYTVQTTDLNGKSLDWSRVQTAVGAGPRLVKDGKMSFTLEGAKAEGFTEAKILTTAAARSGIMVKKDGTVIIATVPAATMSQWGYIMLQLGAVQAMNLDGGASSGLYGSDKIITPPGRLISNALVFGNNLKW